MNLQCKLHLNSAMLSAFEVYTGVSDIMNLNVNGTLADNHNDAGWSFGYLSPVRPLAYVNITKWNASVPAGTTRRRHPCRCSTVDTHNLLLSL